MTENIKTEKWSSLRLDLQQFSPQEFVTACWTIVISCQSKGYISNDGNIRNAVSHSGNHPVTFTMQSMTTPTNEQIKSKLSGYDSSSYSSSTIKNQAQFDKYAIEGESFSYNNTIHFVTSFNPNTSPSSDPNVSN